VVPTFPVKAAVFYDENGNGVLDGGEGNRLPDVVVEVGGRTAKTTRPLGEATIDGVAQGARSLTVRGGSLPPYFVPPASIPVTVPQGAGQFVLVPVTLPIGTNRPSLYMGFGDSITIGQGSSDDQGYRGRLQDKLTAFYGTRASVVSEGQDATKSNRGADRIDESLQRRHPAYTLILYGTNDWNAAECKNAPPCYTIISLRDIVLSARGSLSLPVLSTIIPGDPMSKDQPSRNEWVAAQDDRIRALAKELNVPLADPQALFVKDPNFAHLYVDHVHPNDAGYELIATAFFNAITGPVAPSSTSLALPALFTSPRRAH
jgi:lysophospholipase L1-like esterase